MFTTRSELTVCLSISQHSVMKNQCVLACCCSGLWSSFSHLAGFLWVKCMPCKRGLHPPLSGDARRVPPSNIPRQSRWTSIAVLPSTGPTCRRTSRTRWCSKWTLRRFAVLLLGSSSTSAAAGVAGAARGVLSWSISSCVSGPRWVLLVATRPAAVSGHHAGAHGGGGCAPEEHVPTALDWGQLRPTDKAMAANSVRTSSSRSTDEDEGLLTKCCIEGAVEKTLKKHFLSTKKLL